MMAHTCLALIALLSMNALADFLLIHDDCICAMERLDGNSVDMILVDLPYGTTACKWDIIIPLESLWRSFKRVAKSNAAMVFTAAQPFTTTLIASNLKEFRYCWVWDKQVGRGHLVAKKRPLARHEDVAVFYQKPPFYNPQMIPRDKPVKGKEGKRTEIMGGESVGYEKTYEYKYPQTIISIPSESNSRKIHPTQKPVALMEYLIRTYTQEGNMVLDCCMGSGSTGVAALRCNRKFIGIEKDLDYYNAAEARIKAEASAVHA